MISEINIKDWERSVNKIELYNCQRETIVSFVDEPDVPFWFDHADGMYSFCKMLDGTVFHPIAWSDVFLWRKKV